MRSASLALRTRRAGGELAVSGMRLDYPVTPFRDGWQHLAEARLVYAVRPDSRWELNFGYIDSSAEEAAYAFHQGQLGLRRVDEWSGGWITGVRLAGGRARYEDEDPFFRETRSDHEARLEIDVLNRRLRIWKLTPRLFGTPDERVLWLKTRYYRMPLFFRPALYFLYRYIFLLGILDGKNGFVFHFLQAFWFRLIVDVRLEELLGEPMEEKR